MQWKYKSLFSLILVLFFAYGCSDSDPAGPTSAYSAIEQRAFELINNYRVGKGLQKMEWSDAIAEECRQHSKNMANGTVAFGHLGIEDRVKRLRSKIEWIKSAENVAYNFGFEDPAQKAVEDWIASESHRINIETASFNLSGMGVEKAADGKYYFTQIFLQKK